MNIRKLASAVMLDNNRFMSLCHNLGNTSVHNLASYPALLFSSPERHTSGPCYFYSITHPCKWKKIKDFPLPAMAHPHPHFHLQIIYCTFAIKMPASIMALMCFNQPEFSSPQRKSLIEGDLSSQTAK